MTPLALLLIIISFLGFTLWHVFMIQRREPYQSLSISVVLDAMMLSFVSMGLLSFFVLISVKTTTVTWMTSVDKIVVFVLLVFDAIFSHLHTRDIYDYYKKSSEEALIRPSLIFFFPLILAFTLTLVVVFISPDTTFKNVYAWLNISFLGIRTLYITFLPLALAEDVTTAVAPS